MTSSYAAHTYIYIYIVSCPDYFRRVGGAKNAVWERDYAQWVGAHKIFLDGSTKLSGSVSVLGCGLHSYRIVKKKICTQ